MSDRLLISMALALGLLWQQALALECAARACPDLGAPASVETCGKTPCEKSRRERPCPAPCSAQRDVPAIPDPVRPPTPSPLASAPAISAPLPLFNAGPRKALLLIQLRETGPPSRARLCVWNN